MVGVQAFARTVLHLGHFPALQLAVEKAALFNDGSLTFSGHLRDSVFPRVPTRANLPPIAQKALGLERPDALARCVDRLHHSQCIRRSKPAREIPGGRRFGNALTGAHGSERGTGS